MSLYDAQYSTGKKGPIPEDVIEEVLAALLRFKTSCQEFGVRNDRVRIVATEATREATNSEVYRQSIEEKTGWKVEMLPKEEEGRIGAMGIASSFPSIKGLVMDLGGGSVQLTWMISENGHVRTSPKGSVGLPYGAAALMKLLEEAENQGNEAIETLLEQLTSKFEQALQDIDVPKEITETKYTNKESASHAGSGPTPTRFDKNPGLTLYLSGGGFRGWGYILMSSDAIQPYPIPLINGYRVLKSSFLPSTTHDSTDSSTFRISSRRASQVPAISFLISALTRSLPSLSTIRFAQGGLREGLLFSTLDPSIRSQNPIAVATLPYAPTSKSSLFTLLQSSIPRAETNLSLLQTPLLESIIHFLNIHSSLSKDIRPAAALRSTTTGILASAHGLAHEDRALLALVLCERWGGEVSPSDTEFLSKLQELVGPALTWWTKYTGCVARGLGDAYPAGIVREEEQRLVIKASWGEGEGKRAGESIVRVEIRSAEGEALAAQGLADALRKVGKRKHWPVVGTEVAGWKVETEVVVSGGSVG